MNINHKVTVWTFGKILNNYCIAIHKRTGSTNLHTVLCDMCTASVQHAWPNNELTQHMISWWITAQCHWACMYGKILTWVAIHKWACNILYLWHNTNCWSDTCMASVHHASTKQWTNSTHGHVQVVMLLTAHCHWMYVPIDSSEWIKPVHITTHCTYVKCSSFSICKPSDTELYCWLRVTGVVEIGYNLFESTRTHAHQCTDTHKH